MIVRWSRLLSHPFVVHNFHYYTNYCLFSLSAARVSTMQFPKHIVQCVVNLTSCRSSTGNACSITGD